MSVAQPPNKDLPGRKMANYCCSPRSLVLTFFLSVDRGIEFQQDLPSRRIAVLVIHAPPSRLADLLPHVPEILTKLRELQPGQIVKVN